MCVLAGSGFVNASFDSTHAESGIVPLEVSVSVPPIVTPHRPRLIEYAAPSRGVGAEPGCVGLSLFAGRCRQCDMRTGTVIDVRMLRVTPPQTNSRNREWP